MAFQARTRVLSARDFYEGRRHAGRAQSFRRSRVMQTNRVGTSGLFFLRRAARGSFTEGSRESDRLAQVQRDSDACGAESYFEELRSFIYFNVFRSAGGGSGLESLMIRCLIYG